MKFESLQEDWHKITTYGQLFGWMYGKKREIEKKTRKKGRKTNRMGGNFGSCVKEEGPERLNGTEEGYKGIIKRRLHI